MRFYVKKSAVVLEASQLIRRQVNPSIYDTLTHYHRLSGIPSLINTSFNMHEEPIICTPAEAVKAFLAANLDALAIGDYLVVNHSPDAIRRRAGKQESQQ